MTATNHVLTGAVIAGVIHNPWLALPVAFFSHFALDGLPHIGAPGLTFDSMPFKIILFTDMSVAAFVLLLLLLLAPASVWLLIACGILCASPDLMWLQKFLAGNRHQKIPKPGPVRRFHSKVQWFERPIGSVVELAWFFAMLTILGAQLLIIR